MASASETPRVPTPPTSWARKYARYVVGFGVGVAVAVAPFLGSVGVPLFTPLAHLLPYYERAQATAIAGFVAGLGALVLEFYGQERMKPSVMRRLFIRLLVLLLVLLVLLWLLHSFFILVLPIRGRVGRSRPRILARLARCPCPATLVTCSVSADHAPKGRQSSAGVKDRCGCSGSYSCCSTLRWWVCLGRWWRWSSCGRYHGDAKHRADRSAASRGRALTARRSRRGRDGLEWSPQRPAWA
jgi:hypothetical protein